MAGSRKNRHPYTLATTPNRPPYRPAWPAVKGAVPRAAGVCVADDVAAVQTLFDCSSRWARQLTADAREATKLVRDARIAELADQGMSQREIAAEVGVAKGTIQNVIDGQKRNTSETVHPSDESPDQDVLSKNGTASEITHPFDESTDQETAPSPDIGFVADLYEDDLYDGEEDNFYEDEYSETDQNGVAEVETAIVPDKNSATETLMTTPTRSQTAFYDPLPLYTFPDALRLIQKETGVLITNIEMINILRNQGRAYHISRKMDVTEERFVPEKGFIGTLFFAGPSPSGHVAWLIHREAIPMVCEDSSFSSRTKQ